VWLHKISISTHGRSLENLRGRGSQKSIFLYEAKSKFPEGWGRVQTYKTFLGTMALFWNNPLQGKVLPKGVQLFQGGDIRG